MSTFRLGTILLAFLVASMPQVNAGGDTQSGHRSTSTNSDQIGQENEQQYSIVLKGFNQNERFQIETYLGILSGFNRLRRTYSHLYEISYWSTLSPTALERKMGVIMDRLKILSKVRRRDSKFEIFKGKAPKGTW